ncbi:mesothelin isoform X1 [Clarias magur]|uniref:Mesothelin isoform X1 n=1 Tax=Clarias magur TaxID=1594786 RepID=A0A8J4TP09_CLAMG|nr:mesothelin isoform X1 [Clarias magur]
MERIDDPASDFLKCVGVPSGPGAGEQKILNLKSLTDALLDVLAFVNSGLSGVPLLNVSAGWSISTTDLLQNHDFIRVWAQVRLTPLLSAASQNFLTCLGYNNFSCQTYQTVVQQLSQQFSSLDPQRQQWIYSHFMKPFLSSNAPAGCVLPGDTTENWLTQNFGSFSVLAQLRDFSSINVLFNAMDVLHLLSPEQKAQLMLSPQSAGLNNESLGVVLGSLLSSLSSSGKDTNTFNGSVWNAGLPAMYSSSPQDPLSQTVNGFMTAFRPVGSFVRDFVSFTHQQDLSHVRSVTLIQAMLNWTLAELAAPYKNTSDNQLVSQTMFDPTDVNSWFTHVVVPVLHRYMSNDIPHELAAVFHSVFYMENSVNVTQDPCSVSLDGMCAVPNVMEQVANILQCAASTNLTLTGETVTSLIRHLSSNLNTLLNQLAHTNISSEDSPFRDILDRIHDLNQADLSDPTFVTMWFRIKLKPLLPTLTPGYLDCLSAKPFTCQTFQILVKEMSDNVLLIPQNNTHIVYDNFIKPFLLQQNSTGGCMANSSYEWILLNLGAFSQFATVEEMYQLYAEFDALEAVDALTLQQIAELIVKDLPEFPDKKQLIDSVFSRILTSVTRRQELPQLIILISEMNTTNPNCLIYQEMFSWLHFASLSANTESNAAIMSSIARLTNATPAVCVSYSSPCNSTHVNESAVCTGVNSSALMEYLNEPDHGSQLCSFSITQYACAQLTGLSAVDLEMVLLCNLYSNNTVPDQTWKLFVTNISPTLGDTLDLLNTTTLQPARPLVALLDAIAEVTFSTFSPSSFSSEPFIQLWFGSRLRPFLPYVTQTFLSCVSQNNFSCDAYHSVITILSQQFNSMSPETQMTVYVYFIHTILSLNQTAGCAAGVNSSVWLSQNFGPFAEYAAVPELQRLNPTFSALEVLDSLTLTQLVEVSTSPALINTPAQVAQVVNSVPDSELSQFFTQLAAALTVGGVKLSPTVSQAFLQQVFARVNLGDPALSDQEVEQWIGVSLKPLISSIQPSDVPQYFGEISQRSCNISHQGVALLDSTRSSFSPDVLQAIYNQLVVSLQGPLLECYNNQSYYVFLQSYIMGFQFPPLSTFLSLIPPDRLPQLLNSMSPAQISALLNHTGAVDSQTSLCELFDVYNQTQNYLQNEPILSSSLANQTLVCVWPRALSTSSQADVDRWFASLVQYLPYLSSDLISPTVVTGASCLAYIKFVSVMESYNFDNAAFTKNNIYETIQAYLTTDNPPKCYNPSDPVLNSTAWFYLYIGSFISFITVNDLEQFGGVALEQFTPNSQNLQLLKTYNVSQDVSDAYTYMLFSIQPDFSIKLLPTQLWCFAPATAYPNLTESDVETIAKTLQQLCTDIDPTVAAALADNVESLTSTTILALGNTVTGLSVGQLESANPSVLLSSLGSLSAVAGWSESQATAIVQLLFSSGVLKITSISSLEQLGNLLIGVPSTMFTFISAESLLKALQSQSFLSHVVNTPTISQEIIVNQIISVNSTPDVIVQNTPDSMAPLIPCPYLAFVSQQSATILNQKQWTSYQAVLFFDVVADAYPNADNISFQVLQGFTCTRVQSFSDAKVKNMIHGCRRRGNKKVKLQESQLTCMKTYVKSDIVTDFTVYPPELLLYYNLSQVQPSMCQSFYSALGYADFNVFSSTLAFRRDLLFYNARQCLGVPGLSVSQTQLDVMGQMVCLFNGSYVLNSDPYVLEKLKLCAGLTADQSSAVENVLLGGNTTYGAPSIWNQTTLMNLVPLPLYLSSNFWSYFTQSDKVNFLRRFIPTLKSSGTSRNLISTMITQAALVSKTRSNSLLRIKRDTGCTAGVITQVQASDPSFPFGYDVNQFSACLSVQTLKENLAAITDKATASDYQKVILSKLNQAYPGGISDTVLQDLGPASRAASLSDISNWNITTKDTLSALMSSYNGAWSPDQVNAIISRYINGNRTLGSLELNALGGTNLCALSTSLLSTISSSSLQFASPLSLSSCSLEQKQVLFSIALPAFSDPTLTKSSWYPNTVTSTTRTTGAGMVSASSYLLTLPYLGGATLPYVQTLSKSNISMDLLTFISLDPNVVNVQVQVSLRPLGCTTCSSSWV